MQSAATQDIVKAAREFRAQGRIEEAYRLVQGAGKAHENLLWQHQPLFWRDQADGNCVLSRRRGSDAAFIRELWSDGEFIQRFHRFAARIPQSLADLERILNSEYASLVGDMHSIHWVVRDGAGKPWGVLSLANIALGHGRAEVLLGVRNDAPFGLAPAAMLLLFRFWFSQLKFHKLYTITFDDNAHALEGVLHLGFKIEGRLRDHYYDPARNAFVDVMQCSLLAGDAFSEANRRLMRRLKFKQT